MVICYSLHSQKFSFSNQMKAHLHTLNDYHKFSIIEKACKSHIDYSVNRTKVKFDLILNSTLLSKGN